MAGVDLRLTRVELPPAAERLRGEVRDFIAEERITGRLEPPREIGLGFDREMSRRIGARGWIGLTWPKTYGGHERSALERYVVTEELLAAAVPVGAHWFADRQSGPVLLRFGTEDQRRKYLPNIVRGDCVFCIGMSEPNSGSDLASLQSRAEKIHGGWRINGHKLWTTNAHRADYMVTLLRTSRDEASRHAGLTQFIIDLRRPGVTVKPVISMAGAHDFNEVFFEDVEVGEDAVIGQVGAGWRQVSAELAYERSGPERWLSAFRLLAPALEALGADASSASRERLGRLLAHLLTLREMSASIAGMLQAGADPGVQAAIVKDLGTRFEQDLVRVVRDVLLDEELIDGGLRPALAGMLTSAQLWSPAFTIRGGTSEILRGVIARGLGLR